MKVSKLNKGMIKVLALALIYFFTFTDVLMAQTGDLFNIAKITVEGGSDDFDLYLDLDTNNKILGLKVNDGDYYSASTFHAQLGGGIAIEKYRSTKVVEILSPKMDLNRGGDLNIRYLVNYVFKSYSTYKLKLLYRNSQWGLYKVGFNGNTTPFNSMHIYPRYFFGLKIGISSIQFN